MRKTDNKDIRVILHNIRSTHNVGSMFRTADAGGVSRVYISGYTPAPLDKFKRKQKDIAKTALGAEDTVPWEVVPDVIQKITELKKEGFCVMGVEQDGKSVDYRQVPAHDKVVLIMGNEVLGMSSELMAVCDVISEIPMVGEKESLNVSVAFGIALFALL